MRFAQPQVLWLLLGIPLLAGLAMVSAAARRRSLHRFAGGAAHAGRFTETVSGNLRAARVLLVLLAAVCGVVAAARPQWGVRSEPISRRGVDVVIAIDTSLSMAAQDVPPDRLGQARHAAASLVRRLAGNRLALVTFAGRASLNCPLTLDHEALLLFLDAVDVEAGAIPGSALAEALSVAAKAFGSERTEGRHRAVVLFSDGEDHEGGIDEAIQAIRTSGATAYTIGCGTAQGGPIALRDESGAPSGYKKDGDGRVVTTRLEEGVLGKVALDTNGAYFLGTPSETEIDEITRAIGEMDEREFGTVLQTRYEERFQIPLALGLVALLVETLLGDRKRRKAVAALAVEESR